MSLQINIKKLGRTDEFGNQLSLGLYTANNDQYARDLVNQGYADYVTGTTATRVNYPYTPIFHGTVDPVNDDGRPNGSIYIKTV
jgi:hypothetical protein